MSDSGGPPASSSIPTGTRLGHYEIQTLIGTGGMGHVYRARDSKLQRDVALKVLPPDIAADPERRQRFEREARAVAALNHPNIVTIHSVDEVDGRVFLTMELVSGQPLSEIINRGRLSLHKLLQIAVPLADAASAAHARGITHRDLKPANVMVTADGHVKVLDFGLAKLLDVGHAADRMVTGVPDVITGEGRILGTIAYMSPEQAEGKPLDGRSDIFSLGVMLYEMATGERPFKGETSLSTLTAIMRDTPKSVTEVNPTVPKELGRVIRRALSKDPDRRQQTGKDLRNELDEIRQELESGEFSTPTAHVAARAAAVEPRRISWVAVGGGLALVAAVGAGLVWSRRGPAGAPPVTGNQPVSVTATSVTSEDGVENFPSLSPDGKWIVYTADEHRSGQTDILLRAVGGQTTINLTRDSTSDDSQPAFSHDGERIAFRSARDGGGLFVMGRTGESVRKLTTEGFNPSWSPDGASIVYGIESIEMTPGGRAMASRLWVVSVSTGDRRQLTTTDGVQPSWSPHGQRIAYWGLLGDNAQRDLWTVAASGGDPVRATNDPATDWSPVWSPDGRYLYFSSNRAGEYNLWRVAIDEATGQTRGEPAPVTIPRQNIGHLSFSADGSALAAVSSTSQNNVEALAFDPQRGTVGARRRVTNSSELPASPSVSRDGQWVAFARLTNGQEDLWVVKADGSGLRQMTNDAARDRRPVWSADGKRLMFYSDRSGTFQVWTIAPDGGGLMQVTDYPGIIIEPVLSPDGTKAIANLPLAAKVVMFDPRVPAAQQKVEELPPFPGGFRTSSWSADGTRLAGFVNSVVGGVVIYSPASRSYEKITPSGLGPVWLPDGRRLLYSASGNLMLVDVGTKVSKHVFSLPREVTGWPELSPDAREIYMVITNPQSDIVLAKLTGGAR